MQKSKFLRQPIQRQHKLLAKILERLYEGRNESLLAEYQELSSELNIPPLPSSSLEDVANRFHDHIALCSQALREDRFLPKVRTQDRESETPFLPVCIYLDNLRSAHNVGSIVRTTEAFRLGHLAFSEKTPDPSNPKVQRTSMGAWQHVAWSRVNDLSHLPRPLLALETSAEAKPLSTFAFPSTFTLIVGNEEYGCSQEVLRTADELLEIPLYGMKNSLNVANAFAIAAAHIRNCYVGS